MASKLVSNRFRGFLPVVVDVETAGFNSETDALLEIAAIFQYDFWNMFFVWAVCLPSDELL